VLNLRFKAVAGADAVLVERTDDFTTPSISSRETAAVRDFDRAYVRIGSKARITAPQH
jgi:hypothetical protein